MNIAIHKTKLAGRQVQTVDAHELEVFLGARHNVSTWIRDRIEQHSLVIDGEDYYHLEFQASWSEQRVLLAPLPKPRRSMEGALHE